MLSEHTGDAEVHQCSEIERREYRGERSNTPREACELTAQCVVNHLLRELNFAYTPPAAASQRMQTIRTRSREKRRDDMTASRTATAL